MRKFFKKVLQCKKLCLKELDNRKNGISGESTIKQIEAVIIPELDKIIGSIGMNTLPSNEDRYLISFANAFTIWGWNMQNPSQLFLLLKELNDDYKKI